MPDIVPDGKTGRLFTPGDAQDLARTVREILADDGALATLRANAREAYRNQYTGEANHESLMRVYRQALARANGLTKAGDESNSDPLPSPPSECREREKRTPSSGIAKSGEQVQA